MATARIEAGRVEAAAAVKVEEIELAYAEWRKVQIANVKAKDKVSGPFWRRVVRTLTWEEAEVEYDHLCEVRHTQQWWGRFTEPGAGLGLARMVRRLAVEAIRNGDGYVMLDHEEVRFLGLGASSLGVAP